MCASIRIWNFETKKKISQLDDNDVYEWNVFFYCFWMIDVAACGVVEALTIGLLKCPVVCMYVGNGEVVKKKKEISKKRVCVCVGEEGEKKWWLHNDHIIQVHIIIEIKENSQFFSWVCVCVYVLFISSGYDVFFLIWTNVW